MSLKDEFLKMQKEADRAIREAEKEIVRSYKVTLDDLYEVSGEMFRKYENHDGKLTYEEMTRYKRLEKLNQILAITIAKMYKETTKEIKSGLERVYDIGFNQVALKVELGTGKRLRGIIRQDVLDRALTNDISGLKWTERMGLHRDHVAMKIRETVTQGLHDGATYKQMADRLNEALSGDVVNPMRIVRTEGHRVFSQAQKDRLDEAYESGTKMTKTWISSKDERVRSTHADMEGVTIPYEDDFVMPDGVEGFAPGIIGAPQHDINCRCTWKIDIVDDEDEKESRQSEDEDGIMRIDLQLFSRKRFEPLIKAQIEQGLLTEESVTKGVNHWLSYVTNSYSTPIETVRVARDRYFHIIEGHREFLMLDEIDRIFETLSIPDEIYKSRNAHAYIKKVLDKTLLVIVDDEIITAYYPRKSYLKKIKAGEKIWGRK